MSIDLSRLEALAARIPRPVVNSFTRAHWYRFDNAKGERAELSIYGPIDDWEGVSAANFVRELKAVTASAIDLHINSPGGLVFDAVAIYTALKRHPAEVDVHIDGLAASAASFVAMAGDSVEIEKPAKMMIHDARGVVIGNSADMREMGDLLDELSDTIADIYAERTGKPAAQWRTAMGKDTWYSAEQAVKAGLADRVAGGSSDSGVQDRTPANSLKSQLIRARARVALERVR
jgi:ATP-dependent protease ClpP protease subunit